MKKQTWLLLAVAVLGTALGIGLGMKKTALPQASGPADALFAQQLPDSQGVQQSLSQWKGKVLVVNFWATWCPPCVEEMPDLVALQNDLASKNLQTLGIGIDTASNIQEFATKHQITYPLYVTGMGGAELARALGNPSGALPFTVLVTADGKIAKTYLGRLRMDTVRADLQALMP